MGKLVLISCKLDSDWCTRKIKAEVTWRYVISQGLKHIEECQPRAQFLQDNFDSVTRARNNMKLRYWLMNKYPKLWNEFFMEEKGLSS